MNFRMTFSNIYHAMKQVEHHDILLRSIESEARYCTVTKNDRNVRTPEKIRKLGRYSIQR